VIRTGKRAFYEIEGLDEASAYERAVPIMTCNALYDDAREGITAFLEKRAAKWTGA
jgi:enoyl-CoA hydratase/carnithine racemase